MFIFSPSIVSIFKAVEGNDLITANTLLKYCSFYLLINGINTTLFFLLRAGGKTIQKTHIYVDDSIRIGLYWNKFKSSNY